MPREARPPTQAILQIAFSPEGRYLVTANLNGTLYALRLAERGEGDR